MKGYLKFLGDIESFTDDIEKIKKLAEAGYDIYGVYPQSIHSVERSLLFIARYMSTKVLVAYGEGKLYNELNGEEYGIYSKRVKACSLSIENSKIIRKAIPSTNPVSCKGKAVTIGMGDRLGIAAAGYIRAIKGYNVFPVLAQQSIRELNLTGRTFEEVLASASWAVMQEGYNKGFGADGDHLKTQEEVRTALQCGFTMITLDCSEHIDNNIPVLKKSHIDELYSKLSEVYRKRIEDKYLNRKFRLDKDSVVAFSNEELKKTVLIYFKAITYIKSIYDEVIKNHESNIDLEISIDETNTPTTPESHYFVASELRDDGIEITSLAPRFCGDFQKGINYIGDLQQFEVEFDLHAKIADKFGYKISIHSGSDKFDIFPIVNRKTNCIFHLKTSGTYWLEAVRVIAGHRPQLFRKMYSFALASVDEARKMYHISADIAKMPDIDTLNNSELPGIMDIEECRQVLHITYGSILQEKKPDGTTAFRNEIYKFLDDNENEYYNALEAHISRHLDLLVL